MMNDDIKYEKAKKLCIILPRFDFISCELDEYSNFDTTQSSVENVNQGRNPCQPVVENYEMDSGVQQPIIVGNINHEENLCDNVDAFFVEEEIHYNVEQRSHANINQRNLCRTVNNEQILEEEELYRACNLVYHKVKLLRGQLAIRDKRIQELETLVTTIKLQFKESGDRLSIQIRELFCENLASRDQRIQQLEALLQISESKNVNSHVTSTKEKNLHHNAYVGGNYDEAEIGDDKTSNVIDGSENLARGNIQLNKRIDKKIRNWCSESPAAEERTNSSCSVNLTLNDVPKENIAEYGKVNNKRRSNQQRNNVKYTCDNCTKEFMKKSILVKHVRSHINENQFCVKHRAPLSRRKSEPKMRLKSRTDDKEFKCTYCSSVFLKKTVFYHHQMMHTGEKPYKCDVCLLTFTRNHSLLVHLRQQHDADKYARNCAATSAVAADRPKTKKSLIRNNGDVKMFKCDHCTRSYSLERNLKSHLKSHANKEFAYENDEDLFECDCCARTYKRECNLKFHLKFHHNEKLADEKVFECHHCTRIYGREYHLKSHLKISHSNERIMCEYCDRMFKEDTKLNTYLKNRLRKSL